VEREHIGRPGSLDAWDGPDALQDVLQDGATAGRSTGIIVIHLDDGGVRWFKSKVNVEDAEKAAKEKASADEENASEGNFRNNQHGAHAAVLAPFAGTSASILESVLQIATGKGEAGGETKQDPDDQGEKQGPN